MDWDLNAIVKSCSTPPSAAAAAPPAADSAITSKSTTRPTADQNTPAAAAIENCDFDAAFDYLASLTFDNKDEDPFGFSDLIRPKKDSGLQELQNSCIPFLPNPAGEPNNNNNNILDSSISDFGAKIRGPIHPQLARNHFQPPSPPTTDIPINLRFDNQKQQLNQPISHRPAGHNIVFPIKSTLSSAASRSRKKKSSQKKLVIQVAAENLCCDEWAWRKYGQKPIKGSPYPRNYYRCSSSKGCTARKQVERSNTDSNMFTVSYTGDHSHPRPVSRNSLSGSVRNKFPTHHNPASNKTQAPTNFEKAINGLSPTTPLSASMEHDAENGSFKGEVISNMDDVDQMEVNVEFAGESVDDDDDIQMDGEDILIPNIMALDDDLIKSLQQLGGAGAGDGVFGSVGRSNSLEFRL